MSEEPLSADALSGLHEVQNHVKSIILNEAQNHEHLDADSLEFLAMYIVGSIGAAKGGFGSDLDLIVMLDYAGDALGKYDWEEYVQHDIESALQQQRTALATPLPDGIQYVDPKLGDQIDCEMFIRDMATHGGYDRIYDIGAQSYMTTTRF